MISDASISNKGLMLTESQVRFVAPATPIFEWKAQARYYFANLTFQG